MKHDNQKKLSLLNNLDFISLTHMIVHKIEDGELNFKCKSTLEG